ncbi:MAG TPA: ROK family protein, partial [Candidatus Cloacimonadota bacterium]|nr:ROK family protein [Candidatus Cloacimonadota bacterium]
EIKSIADLLDLTNVNSKVHRKVEELLTYLGVTIANAITILDPHVVCIGGGVVDIPNFDFSFLQNIIKEYLAINYQGTLITKANFGNQAGIYGGILIAEIKYLEHFLLDK